MNHLKANRVAIWVAFNLLFANLVVGMLPANILRFFISMWMPAMSAACFAFLDPAPLRETLNLRFGGARAYLWAAIYPMAVAAGAIILGFVSGHLQWNPNAVIQWPSAVATLAVWTIASLGEEVGWRGYLHNHVRTLKHAPLLIGLIWAAWHARQIIGDNVGPRYTDLVFLANVILISYFLSWLAEASRSVLVCGFFHGLWNFLRMKIIFGNPAQGTHGLFLTDSPSLTEMEGLFGLGASLIVSLVVVPKWYRQWRQSIGERPIAQRVGA